jgi:hypothetical protein
LREREVRKEGEGQVAHTLKKNSPRKANLKASLTKITISGNFDGPTQLSGISMSVLKNN